MPLLTCFWAIFNHQFSGLSSNDQYKENRLIASCRTAAYRTRFRQFTDVAMADFDDSQIEQYITNWFSSPEDREAKKARTCWDILQQPENKAAKELAQTPLLLTFLCLVYGRPSGFRQFGHSFTVKPCGFC